MTYVADFAFVAYAIMIEPLGWGVLLGSASLGGTRQPWWSTLLLAVGATICGVTVLSLRLMPWPSILILPSWLDLLALYVFFCVVCGLGWVVGRACRSAYEQSRSANHDQF